MYIPHLFSSALLKRSGPLLEDSYINTYDKAFKNLGSTRTTIRVSPKLSEKRAYRLGLHSEMVYQYGRATPKRLAYHLWTISKRRLCVQKCAPKWMFFRCSLSSVMVFRFGE